MSALQRIAAFLTFRDLPANRPPQVRAALPSFPEYQRGKALWLDHSPATYVDDGYNKVVVAYRCVNVLANAIASAPLRVYQDLGAGQMEPVEPADGSSAGRLAALIRDPNPFVSQVELLGLIAKISLASGFCVYEKERGPLGQVIGLYPLRSDWLRAVPRGGGRFDWEYRVPGHRDPFTLDYDDVGVFVAEPAPDLSPLGVAPLAAALREVGIENDMTDFVKVLFQNNAVPSFIAILKDEYGNIKDDEAAIISERMRQKFGGGRGAGVIGVMPALQDIRRVGFDFDEMAYPELRALTSLQICTAFGVPPILVGIQAGLDASTYSNYGQARRAFYEDTVTPLWARLDGAMTRALLGDFDVAPNVSLEFDTSEVPALQDDLSGEREQHIKLWQSQVITRNELRASFGFAEIEDEAVGGEFYQPMGPFLLDGGGEERGLGGLSRRLMNVSQGLPWGAFAPPARRTIRVQPWTPGVQALISGEKRVTLPTPETRAAVAATARDAYDRLAARGAPALRRFWRQQGERVIAKARRSVERSYDEWLGSLSHQNRLDHLGGEPGKRTAEQIEAHWALLQTDMQGIDRFRQEVRDIAQIDWNEEEELLAEVLQALHERAARAGWFAAAAMGVPESAYDVANPFVREVLDALAERIRGINRTTMQDVRRVVGDALDEGVTMDELAARLRGLFAETYRSRSLTVARTESQAAYNLGTAAAGRDSGVASYAELMDNAAHDTDPGSDGLTCAGRNGLIVPLDQIGRHVSAEHPNGSLAVALVVDAIEE